MAGFENDVMYALNGDFTQADNQAPSQSNGLVTNGQLWIGSTALNAGSTHINVGTITSPGGTVTIGYISPNITLAVGATVATTYQADAGSATPALNILNVLGTGGISTSGAGNTLTITSGATVPLSFPTDSGTATPAANALSILGRSGSKTGGAGSTVTVRSPPYADQGGSTTVTLNSGSFATAAITLTTPATAGLLDGDLLEFVATNGVLVIQLAATQVGHLGSSATSVAGTFTSTATGDSLSLRYQASTNDWWATSSIGNWTIA